jgi:hypothetical protein
LNSKRKLEMSNILANRKIYIWGCWKHLIELVILHSLDQRMFGCCDHCSIIEQVNCIHIIVLVYVFVWSMSSYHPIYFDLFYIALLKKIPATL